MPIQNIANTAGAPTVSKECIECGHEHRFSTNVLVLGVAAGPMNDPNMIALPACPGCGAQEILVRTWDVHPVEDQAGHRKIVNALAQHLKSTGKTHPDLDHQFAAEAGAPPQLGELFGDVPESSLPSEILQRRAARGHVQHLARRAKEALQAAGPATPSSPMSLVTSMFAAAQSALDQVLATQKTDKENKQ